jgi:tRNA U34 5-methylaminomethyl-2-thiouridine-forming methyltransferase MnmC
MEQLEIITTSDGSHTVWNKELNETYHSIHGAVQESMHVFIQNGLEYYRAIQKVENLSILEVGFGTGLNALLTLRCAAENQISIAYTALEPFPLPRELWTKLNFGEAENVRGYFHALHQADWNVATPMTPAFTLLKLKQSLEKVVLADLYNLVYFDAFAPSVQPELWNYGSLKKVVSQLRIGGVFVTYSAKGQLKRDLKSLGLRVETLPGPPGKNEMVRALAV